MISNNDKFLQTLLNSLVGIQWAMNELMCVQGSRNTNRNKINKILRPTCNNYGNVVRTQVITYVRHYRTGWKMVVDFPWGPWRKHYKSAGFQKVSWRKSRI